MCKGVVKTNGELGREQLRGVAEAKNHLLSSWFFWIGQARLTVAGPILCLSTSWSLVCLLWLAVGGGNEETASHHQADWPSWLIRQPQSQKGVRIGVAGPAEV